MKYSIIPLSLALTIAIVFTAQAQHSKDKPINRGDGGGKGGLIWCPADGTIKPPQCRDGSDTGA